jgi:hypothetical protein
MNDQNTSWTQLKERIKESNTSITDEDLVFDLSKRDQLFDHLAGKLHKSREEVRIWIESLAENKSMAG